MNILIIENEIYLSHSIAQKLVDIGYSCSMCIKSEDISLEAHYDVVLLSTSVDESNCRFIKENYKDSIIILLASYISNDTISNILNNGASDYILKPFMIDQLVNKIEHQIEYKMLKVQNDSYEKYLSHSFLDVEESTMQSEIKFPLFISSNIQKNIDAFVYRYAKERDVVLHFVSLKDSGAMKEIKKYPVNTLVYISDFHMLNGTRRKDFFEYIVGKEFIIANMTRTEIVDFSVLELETNQTVLENDTILEIEGYFKHIIRTYQNTFNDTELSKKLGISRKSIWEKRKRYSIAK
ncbi:MAG: DNA-binding NtrC family response regulator [Sulfurimonas sp.]|uniref:hypothetical protein n=1 Tax=Sulfurimonas sp. TaxID=2022749 RepID=UPI0039E596B9